MSPGVVLQGFWWGFVPAALLASPILKLLVAGKSRQTVSAFAPEGHQVKQGTPTMGGLVFVLGLLPLLISTYFASAPNSGPDGLPMPNWWAAALVLLVGFGLIGFVDDYVVPKLMPNTRGLGWKPKLLMQVGFGFWAAALMFGIAGSGVWIATFVILFFSNAYNFADGLDALSGTLLLGLTAGLVAIGCIYPSDSTTVPVMAALFGATIPFLYMNAPPAKVFMGDVGALPIGALLGAAVCSIWLRNPVDPSASNHLTLGLGILSFMMIAELVPVPLQIFWVKVFKKRLFPFTPIHHAFEKAGWKETRVVGAFALTQLLLTVLAVTIIVMP